MNPPNTEAHDKEQGTHYKELNPVKDPEKSLNVDIPELLEDHLTNLVRGRVPPNFNSAALLPQGSSCVYDKKVEYLSKLANQLHQKLAKEQKAEQQNRKETAKEKERQKEEKLSDPFLSTEIKLGKNLSCLKSVPKNAVNKQPCKKTQLLKSPFVPMLDLEDDEKGDVIFK
ncbi:condensin-2 complex subunit H2-like [Stegodyphus dumicola]|uniref:condensin-2 complex subunit H2-like n=1 Tax=Stegodyphus dumicola TaxID=202533 RepID=UPI0015B12115|nr:condensin-2 complex subunit H2-like [Stegodyphus dumicola]